MSGSYQAAHERLAVVLEAASAAAPAKQRFRVERKPGPLGNPPTVYIPPPELTWDAVMRAPTEAVFEVVVAVAADEFAIERLFALLPIVTTAIDDAENLDASVLSATPGVWRSGNVDLPCYFVRTEIATS